MKKIIPAVILLSSLLLCGCSHKEKSDQVSVGTIAGPETELMDVAKQVALKRYGLHVKIVTFTDYSLPNAALEDGDIDANAFQHYPFLLSQMKAHGYHFSAVGSTFLYPMGLYSKTIKSLDDLKPGSEVAIPNDPSNEARALLLLQKAKLIALNAKVSIDATTHDIVSNPEKLKIVSLDAAQIPRVLSDVALAAINTNYATPSGLSPSKALFVESIDSPYMNLIVARTKDKHEKKIKELVAAYQSKPVVEEAKKLFGDEAIPGFEVK